MMTRIFLIAICACLLGFGVPAKASDTTLPYFAQVDKQAHILISTQLSLAMIKTFEHNKLPRWSSILLASALMFGAGAAKEILIDKQYTPEDQWANVIGSASAGILVITLDL